MKKIVLITVLFFNIVPYLKHGVLKVWNTQSVMAQDANAGTEHSRDEFTDSEITIMETALHTAGLDDPPSLLRTDLNYNNTQTNIEVPIAGTSSIAEYTYVYNNNDPTDNSGHWAFTAIIGGSPFTGNDGGIVGSGGPPPQDGGGGITTDDPPNNDGTGGGFSLEKPLPPPSPPASPPSQVVDCAGILNGSAYVAACGCIGGTTGISACPPPVFKHFSESTITNEITDRQNDHFKIQQGTTGLCGIACIVKTLLDHDPNGYKSLVNLLYYNGSATYLPTGYKIDVNGKPLITDADPNSSSFPRDVTGVHAMPQSDFILLCSIKNTQNLTGYSPPPYIFNQGSGMTLPGGMKDLMTNLLGMQVVKDDTRIGGLTNGGGTYSYADMISIEQFASGFGFKEYLLIDALMLDDPNGGSLSFMPNHWVEYISNSLVVDETNNNLTFDVFSWGQRRKISISFDNFKKYFYGNVYGRY